MGAAYDGNRGERKRAPCMLALMDPTERFSDRVKDYVQHRPGYPEAVFDAIVARTEAGLPRVAADVGSGTGIFSRGLLARGWRVLGVEPNAEMRAAAERELGGESGFASHAGRAEETGLAAESVALIVAAQAFHWFDASACRREWQRILMPRGLVALVWNVRQLGSSFMNGYEAALRDGTADYLEVIQRHAEPAVVVSFEGMSFEKLEYPNHQIFDWQGFRGRVLSSSYVPKEGQPGHDELMRELRRLFEAHEERGLVQFDYSTTLYVGRLAR